MANNKIQIKRSTSNATVTGLSAGELAFTQAGNTLHIGLPDGSGVIRIGGAMVPGTLTANQALVANATSAIDKVIVANLVPTTIWANGAAGSAGQVLHSNGSVAYWANTVADITSVVAGNGLTGGGTSGDVTLDVGSGNGISVSADAIAVIANSGLVANATGIHIVTSGDTTLIANSTGLYVNDATISIASSQISGDIALGTQTSGNYVATITAGNGISGSGNGEGSTPTIAVVANSGITANSTGVFAAAANGISVTAAGINVLAGNSQLVSNSTGVWVNQAQINHNALSNYVANQHIDHSTVSISAGNGITGGGDLTATRTISVNANSGLVANTTGVFVLANSGLVSNSTGVFVLANNGITSNSTGVFAKAANGISVDSSGINVTAGTNGGLVSNSTGVFAKAANGISIDSSGINVTAGSGGGLVSNSTGVFVTAGSGLVANATGVHVGSGNGISVSADALAVTGGSTLTVNATGVHVNNTLSITSLTTSGDVTVNGNTKLGDSSADVVSFIASVNTSINPSANVTYSLGTNNLRWNEIHASNVHSTTGYFDGGVQVGGDLVVLGNVTTTNVSSIIVSDPMIYLAGNNYTSDLVDIGLAANYFDGATQRHTGLFRDASDSGIWKLFQGSEQELSGNNVVNTAANGFTLAILQAYLQSSVLTTNSSSVYITANSTVNVNITANTLTLSSPLAATSGGTGYSSYTAQDILVASNTTSLSKLALGTSGYVLQSNGSALVYDTLDGGTF